MSKTWASRMGLEPLWVGRPVLQHALRGNRALPASYAPLSGLGRRGAPYCLVSLFWPRPKDKGLEERAGETLKRAVWLQAACHKHCCPPVLATMLKLLNQKSNHIPVGASQNRAACHGWNCGLEPGLSSPAEILSPNPLRGLRVKDGHKITTAPNIYEDTCGAGGPRGPCSLLQL